MVAPRIFWFRRDLRLGDNLALLEAVERGEGRVVPVFVIEPRLCAGAGPARSAYLLATLRALDASLGGRLVVRSGDPSHELSEVAAQSGAREVVATEDYAPWGRRRDADVTRTLQADGIGVIFRDSPYVVAPGSITTRSGTPYRVFTPFRRSWEQRPSPDPMGAPTGVTWLDAARVEPSELLALSGSRRPWYFADVDPVVSDFTARAGELCAAATLRAFATRVTRYGETRDLPGVAGTSRLSAFLRFGALHPRQVVAATTGLSRGAEGFLSELCWREFYADVVYHQPDSTWRVLQPALRDLRVDTDAAAVERFGTWTRGETGYPLVDAGMRQLLREGWMHNRVRMVAASFLVKHLHVDWRWGAKWFMWCLIDGDIASNQHGWQWVAGTGTDAAPFHRIFNPTLQAQRFDPEGTYVHRYVPELRDVAPPRCLSPGGGDDLFSSSGYVAPMVDAGRERDEALARYHEARATHSSASRTPS